MEDPEEHALVVKALTEGLSNCVEWKTKSAELLLEQYDLNPGYVRRETIRHVRAQKGSAVEQRNEIRGEFRADHRFWYRVILPLEGYPRGFFVEMILTRDDDPDFPVVTLVSAHP